MPPVEAVEDGHALSAFVPANDDASSAYGRGVEWVVGPYAWPGLAPKGRGETEPP